MYWFLFLVNIKYTGDSFLSLQTNQKIKLCLEARAYWLSDRSTVYNCIYKMSSGLLAQKEKKKWAQVCLSEGKWGFELNYVFSL